MRSMHPNIRLVVRSRSSQLSCKPSKRKFTLCRTDRSRGRVNFSFQAQEEEEKCFDLVSNWPLTSPCPRFHSPPPPPILSVPLAPEPQAGFSAATARLFHPSRLLASVSLSALSFAAYSYPWLPPSFPPPPLQ